MGSLRETEKMEKIGRELGRLGLDVEIIAAAKGSRAVGASIAEIERLAAGAFMIVAIEQKDSSAVFQPPTTMVVEAGNGVAVVGRPTRAAAMQAIFMPSTGRSGAA